MRLTHRLRGSLPALLLLPLVGAASPSSPMPAAPVHGDYVEARTASVFAGACHYNGERVTEGRSAVLAWHVTGGSVGGVDLTDVRVIAAVACDDNLAERGATRRSSITVDAPGDAQATAAVDWIKARCAAELGTVVEVRRAAITFRREAESFEVSADHFAAMSVRAMPDHACCSQPQLVWYQPLMPLVDRRVGYTEAASLDAPRVGSPWQRSDENSAIYGTFDH